MTYIPNQPFTLAMASAYAAFATRLLPADGGGSIDTEATAAPTVLARLQLAAPKAEPVDDSARARQGRCFCTEQAREMARQLDDGLVASGSDLRRAAAVANRVSEFGAQRIYLITR